MAPDRRCRLPAAPQGYASTRAGEAIRAHVERVEAEARTIAHVVGDLDQRLEGTVRVVSTALLASHLLVPCTAALATQHPGLTLALR